MELSSSKIKKFLYFLKKCFPYISRNGIFFKKILIFQGRTLRNKILALN